LCGLGIYFLRDQSVDLLPRITYPLVRIRIAYPGASPEEVETNVTRRLEALVSSAEDAIKVTSTITEGSSHTDVYFNFGKDMDAALNDVRARLDRLANLPDGVERPVVMKADPSQMPVLDLAIASDKLDEIELNRWANNDLAELFMGIEGLASINVSGGKMREIGVIFIPEMLARHEISVSQIITRLAQENVDIPGGYITSKGQELTVRVAARFQNLEDIGNVIITNREGEAIRLNDLARVYDTHADQRVIVRVNGHPSVVLSFVKQPNANTAAVCDDIKKKIDTLRSDGMIPEDVQTRVVNDQSYYIKNSVQSVSQALLIGGGLAVLVVFLFLGSVIRTAIVAAAIPVSLLFTFFLMGLAGITINMISLGGLVLGVGMLLDNSIVMLENITRHQKMRSDRMEATGEGSTEVSSAIVASTGTNLASVVPFLMVSSIAILIFRDLILTISIAITASMLTALTVVPTLAARLTKFSRKTAPNGEKASERAAKVYAGILDRVLKHRWKVTGALLIAGALSFFCLRSSGSEFMPQIDDGRITVSLELPRGTALKITDDLSKRVEAALKENNGDIETMHSSVGGFWFAGGISSISNRAVINIQLKNPGIRKRSTEDFIKATRQKLKEFGPSGAEFKITRARLRGLRIGSADEAVEIKIFGPEIRELDRIAGELIQKLKGVEGLTNLDTSLDMSLPELHIALDRKKLSNFGLSADYVGESVRATLNGIIPTRYTDPSYQEDFDVRVIYDREKFGDPEAVKNMLIYSPYGFAVKLGEIADVRSGVGPASIERENQTRLIRVLADISPGFSAGEVTDAAEKIVKDHELSPPYRFEIGGDAESIAESNRAMLAAAMMAVFLVFGIMAVQFESLRDPLVIMFTVPFAVMGAIFSLTITGTPFSAIVFLGMILLVGIAVNNGIVMVNYFGILRKEHGKTAYEAVTEGAPTRLRPVLMTGITTIFGLIPMALGLGEGSELLAPLGISVIGGMILATFLTLFVIPSIYLIFNPEK
jgi:CzcA family heavy metal efflux pump